MTRLALVGLALATSLTVSPAFAAPVTVLENPAAPTSNFAAPTNQATVGYTIDLSGDGDSVNGVLTTTNPNALNFANLYFDLNPNSGSDLGFELAAGRALQNVFIPSTGASATVSGITTSFVNGVFNFEIPNTFFTSGSVGTLNFAPSTGSVRLNLSQSFGYSVAGGQAFFGDNRLGVVSLAAASAVPEPTTWAFMLVGFGAVGYSMRRKSTAKVTFATA